MCMYIISLLKRKFRSAAQVRNHNQMSAILQQLITLEPHIKVRSLIISFQGLKIVCSIIFAFLQGSDPFYSVIDCLEKIPEIRSTFGYDVEAAVEVSFLLLFCQCFVRSLFVIF